MHALQDLQGRLANVGRPVLLPEERQTVTTGRKPGQTTGVRAYLVQNTVYYQLFPERGGPGDGVTGEGLVQIDVVGLTRAASTEYARLALPHLLGTPRDVTPYDLVSRVPLEMDGAFITRLTLSFTTEFGGV